MQNSQITADRIKSLAQNKGISVSKLLSDCELNKNAIFTMQSNGYYPRAEALIKIADYLDCSVDYLLGRIDIPNVCKTANIIRVLCKRKGVELADMLKEYDLPPALIYDMENANKIPPMYVLNSLAEYFDVTVDYLLGKEFNYDDVQIARKNAKELSDVMGINFDVLKQKTGADYGTFRTWCDNIQGFGDYFNDKLYLIADLFGISVEQLVGRETHRSDYWAETYYQLDSEDKDKVYDVMQQMLKADKYITSPVVDTGTVAAYGGETKTVEVTEESAKRAAEAAMRLKNKK